MSTKSREYLYGNSIRFSAEKAKLARQEADKLACEAWNMRMLGYKGPAQPSPMLGDALNAGYRYLEVRCLGCDTHQTIALDIVRRPKTTPVHELERYMRCKDCSQMRSYPYKRSHLIANEGSEQEVLGEKDGGQWRDNFKLLFKEGSKPIYPNPLWERRLELRELVNWVAGIYKD
jgi:hypothetical protein